MSQSEILEAVPLTADDLAAIKLADSYSLHTHSKLDAGNGSLLRLYVRPKRADKGAFFTARQQILFPEIDTRVRDIVIDGSVVGYGKSTGWTWPNRWMSDSEPTPACFFSGWDTDMWATIARALRVGTVLKVVWIADNNNEIVEEAGLHVDSVKLTATTGKHADVWNLGTETGRDNSARMIRRQH